MNIKFIILNSDIKKAISKIAIQQSIEHIHWDESESKVKALTHMHYDNGRYQLGCSNDHWIYVTENPNLFKYSSRYVYSKNDYNFMKNIIRPHDDIQYRDFAFYYHEAIEQFLREKFSEYLKYRFELYKNQYPNSHLTISTSEHYYFYFTRKMIEQYIKNSSIDHDFFMGLNDSQYSNKEKRYISDSELKKINEEIFKIGESLLKDNPLDQKIYETFKNKEGFIKSCGEE